MVAIRPATQQDDSTIKRMIRQAHLDPTSLKWEHFLIAEDDGQIIGIGQIRQHPGCQELGSLVVDARYRGRGIGALLIAELEKQAEFPLYLFCASKTESYYLRFGYRTIGWWSAPRFLKLKPLPTLAFRLFGVRILIMRKDAPS